MKTIEILALIKTELSHRDNTISQLRENAKQDKANYASLLEDYRGLVKRFNERQADAERVEVLTRKCYQLQAQLDALMNARRDVPRGAGKFGSGAGDMDMSDNGLVTFAETDK